jgi:anti-anti-sigma factor
MMVEKAAHFRSEKAKDGIAIYVEGEFTYENTGAFRTLVKKLITGHAGPVKIKLDLANCPFVDSGCMGAMAQVHKELKSRGGELLIVNANHAVLEAMRRIRLDSIISVKGKKK